MKVIMLKTVKGSEDGIIVKTYEKDKDYSITEYLYKLFIANKFCKDFTEVKTVEIKKEEIKEEKKIDIAPDNKMMDNKKYSNKGIK